MCEVLVSESDVDPVISSTVFVEREDSLAHSGAVHDGSAHPSPGVLRTRWSDLTQTGHGTDHLTGVRSRREPILGRAKGIRVTRARSSVPATFASCLPGTVASGCKVSAGSASDTGTRRTSLLEPMQGRPKSMTARSKILKSGSSRVPGHSDFIVQVITGIVVFSGAMDFSDRVHMPPRNADHQRRESGSSHAPRGAVKVRP